jgi:hypothetical protein
VLLVPEAAFPQAAKAAASKAAPLRQEGALQAVPPPQVPLLFALTLLALQRQPVLAWLALALLLQVMAD